MIDKLMAQFIEEGRELASSAAQGLLKLEKSPRDHELLNTLFRDVHTLKGSAGVLELTPMVSLVHVAEELLERAKEGEGVLDAAAMDVLLDAMDLLNDWFDQLEDAGKLGADAEERSRTMVSQLSLLRDSNFGGAAQPAADEAGAAEDPGEGVTWGLFDDAPAAPTPEASGHGVAPAWLLTLSEADRLRAWSSAMAGETLWCLTFSPERDCYFRGDDPLFMARQTPGLLGMHIGLHPTDEDIADMDVYQCRLWFGLLAQQSAAALDEHFQYESDTVTREPLLVEGLIQPLGQPLNQPLDSALLQDLDQHWHNRNAEAIGRAIDVQLELLNSETREASLLRWLRAVSAQAPDDAVVFDTLLTALREPDGILDASGHIDWEAHLPAPAATSPAPADNPAETEGDAAVPPEVTLEVSADAAALPELEGDDARVAAVLQDQLRLLNQCREPDLQAGALASAQQVMRNVARSLQARLPAALETARDTTELGQALRDWLGSERQSASPAAAPVARSAPVPDPAPAPVAPEPAKAPAAAADKAVREAQAPVIRTFKVDQEQVENLGDLVGELVVAKNALPFLAQRAEQVFGQRQLGREIREQFNVINRITRALQDAMMQVQMLPVSHVFDRFPRLVRDLSRKLDKPIELQVEGADTEAEKHVIESLSDPLIHLMRNAIDHGIEPRDVRKAAGKPETGQINLSARQDNEWVVIEVIDDGGGIDPDKTRRKAYEKGLVDERRLKDMSDQEAIELIFMAGFSTLEAASDLSGRGVGMDVVQTTIEKAGGRLDVESRLGEGTRMRIWLPLSMSISQVMQIWIDGQRYGIPMDQVAETVRLPHDRLHRFKDRETVMLRDRVLPVCRGRDQLGLETREDGDTVALLVVRYRGELVALMVDDFSEGVEVILKPMEGALEHLGAYQGTALLGDGSVLLVLNMGVLLSTVRLEEVADADSGER